MRGPAAIALLLVLAAGVAEAGTYYPRRWQMGRSGGERTVLYSRSQIAGLDTTGSWDWRVIVTTATDGADTSLKVQGNNAPDTTNIDVQDQDDKSDTYALAYAMYGLRLSSEVHLEKARRMLRTAMRDWDTATVSQSQLAAARNMGNWIVVSNLVTTPGDTLDVRIKEILNRYLVSTKHTGWGGGTQKELAEQRPQNQGAHGMFSRAALAAYLQSDSLLNWVYVSYREWVGDIRPAAQTQVSTKSRWDCQSNDWPQYSCLLAADSTNLTPINPAGSTIGGNSVDGWPVDDISSNNSQPTLASFVYPPRDSLGSGAFAMTTIHALTGCAEIFYRLGYAGAYAAGSNALLRAVVAFKTLSEITPGSRCDEVGENCDIWWPGGSTTKWGHHTKSMLPVINRRYGTNYQWQTTSSPCPGCSTPGGDRPGGVPWHFAFTGWTYR